MNQLDGIYINLDRSHARDAAMRAELDRVGMQWVKRFAAIDGANVTPPAHWPLERGTYGCFLSHRAAIMAADPDSFTLILEDDLDLSDDLPSLITPQQVQALAEWDMVFLECQPNCAIDQYFALWPSMLRQLRCYRPGGTPGDRGAAGVEVLDAKPVYRWGATAYLVTPRGKRTLSAMLPRCETDGPFDAIDSVYCLQILANQIRASVLMPFLAAPRPQQLVESTIPGRRAVDNEFLLSTLRRSCFAGPLGEFPGLAAMAAQDPLASDAAVRLVQSTLPGLFGAMASLASSNAAKAPTDAAAA